MKYEVEMTGSPPKKMRWRLDTKNPRNGVKIRIKFPSAMARAVTINDEEIPYNQWVKSATVVGQGEYGPITGSKCGENRYIAVQNILEFYLTGECEIKIIPRDAIMTKVRMEWTMDAFFKSGGTTAFIDRLCASLGIHASTVKIVGVRKGSVIVEYEIIPSADEPMSIEQIYAKQTQQFATGTIDLGAPILDVTENGDSIVSDGVVVAAGFDSKVLVITPTNQANKNPVKEVVEKVGYDYNQLLTKWIYPFLWDAAQVGVVDAPSMIGYEFLSLGL